MPKTPWMRFDFFVSSAMSVISAALSVALAFFLMAAVDAATLGDWMALLHALFLTILIALGDLVVSPLSRHFGLRYVRHYLELSKNSLYKSKLNGFNANFDNNIANFSTDIDVLHTNFYLNHVLIVGSVARLTLSVAGIIFIDWRLFLAAIIPSLLPLIAPSIFKGHIGRSIASYSEKSKQYLDFVGDSFEGIHEVKSFSAQNFFINKHNIYNRESEVARASNRMANFIMRSTTFFLGSFVFISIIGVGGILNIQGAVSIGALIAVVQLLNGVVNPIGEIASAIGEMRGAKGLAHSYFFETIESDGADVPDLTRTFEVHDVCFSYVQNQSVLNKFSASFEKGGTYAIVGPSGSGKSTLAKILAGVLQDYEGKVLLDGIDIKTMNRESYCKKVMYIHQFSHLFKMSIDDNINLGSNNESRNDLFASLGMNEFVSNRGMEMQIQQKENISGGQKQRIILARALNAQPDVLILDEPTANLDLDSAISILSYLADIDNLTLIVITHADNPKIIELFTNVIKLNG